MFTFKAQAKSNAKRFLLKTCGINEGSLPGYLIQVAGAWGTYVDADGKPVPHNTVEATRIGAESVLADPTASQEWKDAAAQALGTPAPAAQGDDIAAANTAAGVGPMNVEDMVVAASAFGAFAMAQLTAPSNTAAPADAPRAARVGVTPTAGLKIQKERETRNGVQRQSPGTVGDTLWGLYDKIGPDCTLARARAVAAANGINLTSSAISLYRWRHYNGYTGKEAK